MQEFGFHRPENVTGAVGALKTAREGKILGGGQSLIPVMELGLAAPSDLVSLARVAELLPATHAMRAYEGLAYRRPTDLSPYPSLLILVAGGVLAFALAILLFSWDSRNTTRKVHPLTALLVLAPYALGALLLG